MEEKLFIGTSGWSYQDWKGIFYPKDLERGGELQYYTTFFNTTEINSTFYRLPYEGMVKGWYNKTPQNFLFSIKVSKRITHLKRLRECKEELSLFFNRVFLLKEKVGVLLYQLPPSLKFDPSLLEEFLLLLPKDKNHVIEFRNNSWFNDKSYEILNRYNVGFCIVSAPKFETILEVTSTFAYIRMHGKEGWYKYLYNEEELRWWSEIIVKFLKNKIKVFCYFNNDYKGNAVTNALRLKELISKCFT